MPTAFDWPVYADATFAGLAVLIPIPVIDGLLELYFRRRMPNSIARRHGRVLPRGVGRELAQSRDFWPGCLLFPIRFGIYLVRNIFRTLVYALSVVDASENLSAYWHRAFLINYAVVRGDFDTPERAGAAVNAIAATLKTAKTSPLLGLARTIIEQARYELGVVFRSILRYARRGQETKEVVRAKYTIATRWREFQAYLEELGGRYVSAYDAALRAAARRNTAGALPASNQS